MTESPLACRIRLALLTTVAALALPLVTQAGLIHRYSFNETTGTTVNDSVGGAHGELKGNGGFFDGAGRLYLPGGGFSADAPEVIAGYVDLPNHIINVLQNITIETWVTWESSSSSWQRVFDFGTSAGGENVVNGGGAYLFCSPQGPDNLRFAVRDPVTGAEPTQLTARAPLEYQAPVCLTITYDTAANVSRLYSNAVLLVTGPAGVALKDINDVNNWLGRSQWNDPMFQGNYDEFRIYDNALNPLEVAASFVAGPATPSTDPARLGALQAVNLNVLNTTMTELDTQPVTASADFANFQDLPLANVPGVTFASDNTSVLTVDAAGVVTAVSPGVAKLTLTFQSRTDEETITVNARQTGAPIVAGTLFVDLRAADASNDTTVWENRAGTGDFYAAGTPTYVANVESSGVAGVRFNPESPFTDAYEGPYTTAELHGGSDRSIEVWAYNPGLADEETLVAWGRRGGPEGSNMSFNYGANGTYGAVGHWGSPDMGWSGNPAAGQWHYLVYTYDGVNTSRVYADGVLKTTKNVGALNTHADLPVRLAAQANTAGTDFEFGQALSGYLAMVRVHTGKLSDADVANNFLFGPTLNPPGALESVALTVSAATLPGPRFFGQAQVVANFANLKNVNVTGFTELTSNDPEVLTVTATGAYTAVKAGTATLSGNYQGRPVSQLITVLNPPPLALKHRYSFSESPSSTTAADSVGSAHGTLKGVGADFDGAGRLHLPGGTASAADPVAGYVDLPNGIISARVNLSFEAWVTWEGSGSWQRIFDFGTSCGGEEHQQRQQLLSRPRGRQPRFAVRDPRTGGEPTQLTAPRPCPPGPRSTWLPSTTTPATRPASIGMPPKSRPDRPRFRRTSSTMSTTGSVARNERRHVPGLVQRVPDLGRRPLRRTGGRELRRGPQSGTGTHYAAHSRDRAVRQQRADQLAELGHRLCPRGDVQPRRWRHLDHRRYLGRGRGGRDEEAHRRDWHREPVLPDEEIALRFRDGSGRTAPTGQRPAVPALVRFVDDACGDPGRPSPCIALAHVSRPDPGESARVAGALWDDQRQLDVRHVDGSRWCSAA
ncbi:MAG: Ig-like domain-containing protein [Verrucomicrobiales bacterium]|nr:Ig-like domain-containing protein [Verrucomicrobiales bacterium]